MGLLGDDRPFAHALTPPEYEGLMALGRQRHFAAEARLLTEGERTRHILLVQSGWATVSVTTDRGSTRLILGLRGPGELLGELAALDSRPRSATVSALGPMDATLVSGDHFRNFLARNPRIGALVMHQLAARLRSADHERFALASLTVLQRLAERLIELATVDERGPYGPPGQAAPVRTGRLPPAGLPVIHLPQDELAATVGATREAVAKALRLLRDQKVVRTGNRRVEILDPELLRLLAAGRHTDRGGADARDVRGRM
jgi:CRP/FNR family cyclic AMP-dependent transcriptional regulator